ncbi:MAG: UDPglucose--hexose-1-phosphate uridylyltransferase [Francisellaceae bacterium]|jgi:UDPglucose--hexose-1-phosphate uridylyltransferase
MNNNSQTCKNVNLTQIEMQKHLFEINKSLGLKAVLKYLYKWSLDVGYLTQGKLNDNKRYEFFDKDLDITFKTQINIARSQYSPKPLSGKNIPKLHCPICFENIGIQGKEDLRGYEFDLGLNRPFFIQLTPFPLYPKHFVLVDKKPTPMIMSEQSVRDLVTFIDLAPVYVGCSNSDVEWAGASILTHHHYQIFDNLHLPIMEASVIPNFSKNITRNKQIITYSLLDYPIATCLVECPQAEEFIKVCGEIIKNWKLAVPGKNTCNLVVKNNAEKNLYQAYIIFRNPDFRTPENLTHIKSEGVGIIEVAGEGIYPVPETQKIWDEIDNNGLKIIKGIIAGNNPVILDEYDQLFKIISTN